MNFEGRGWGALNIPEIGVGLLGNRAKGINWMGTIFQFTLLVILKY